MLLLFWSRLKRWVTDARYRVRRDRSAAFRVSRSGRTLTARRGQRRYRVSGIG